MGSNPNSVVVRRPGERYASLANLQHRLADLGTLVARRYVAFGAAAFVLVAAGALARRAHVRRHAHDDADGWGHFV